MAKSDLITCRLTYHGRVFEGSANKKEAAFQRALDKWHAFIGMPTEAECKDLIDEYF